jgi:hypothetical protein
MEKAIKNTMYEYTFEDGTKENLTLAFYALYQLKAKDKVLYEECNILLTRGVKEVIDMITLLYGAYLCANIGDIANCMSREEFMQKCGSDYAAVKTAMEHLVTAKKQ